MRPKAFLIERDAGACADPAALRRGVLERHGNLHIQTGNDFVKQWQSQYFSQIMPFVIPRMCSGPDFDKENRWRRTSDDYPFVRFQDFVRGFPRRVEAAVRNDATAVPIVRSVYFKWAVEHSSSLFAPYSGKRGQSLSDRANDTISAAQTLLDKLWHGHTGTGTSKVPIAGDSTRLPYAHGLTPIERRLAWNMNFKARQLPGTQQLRLKMGHAQFGARVVYGDCLFSTISPNELHSALVLRLSRYRLNDPFLQVDELAERTLRQVAPRDQPSLMAGGPLRSSEDLSGSGLRSRGPADEEVEVLLDLPEYEQRRISTARDPLAVIDAHLVNIKLRLPRLFGTRMCPRCPHCNSGSSRFPCQNKFGSNMMPMGGVIGGVPAFGAATEHQGHGTPHLHAEAHVACAYQYGTLEEIAKKIKSKS